jgi:hypothetical protein
MEILKGRGGISFRDFTCFNKALLAKTNLKDMENTEQPHRKNHERKIFSKLFSS